MNKKFTLFASSLFILMTMKAVVPPSIPNGGFENWTTTTYDYPTNYPGNSNAEAVRNGGSFTAFQTTDKFHGNYALKLTSTDTQFGYIYNSESDGGPSDWTNGAPMTGTPTGIRGYYKYNVATADSATIIVTFRKAGVSIGSYVFLLGGIEADYKLFDFPLVPALTESPDSVVLAVASSNVMKDISINGSTLYIDSISLTGIATQPALLNGDFEDWSSTNIKTADYWEKCLKFNAMEAFERTIDSRSGNYAMKIKTIFHESSVVSAQLTNGEATFDGVNYSFDGGLPFTSIKDTLCFYYKYIPAHPSDVAAVSLYGYTSTNQVGGALAQLDAKANYTYGELPFNFSENPEMLIIKFTSGNQGDPKYVGTELYIDDIKLKSEINTGVSKVENQNISIFPNPCSSILHIQLENGISVDKTISILDAQGKCILKKSVNPFSVDNQHNIDISSIENGIYFVVIASKNGISIKKISIQH